MEANKKAKKMKFKTDVIIYGIEPGNSIKIFRNDETLGYCFINTGNTALDINNFKLLPGAVFKTFEPNCKDLTFYRVKFNQNNGFDASCATNNSVLTCIIYSSVV